MAILVAVVAAGAATLMLRPRSGLIEPAPVRAQDYFSPKDLHRAEDFRSTQRLLAIAGLAVSGGTLVLLAVRPPPGARRLLARASSRPLLGAAGAGAGIVVVLALVALPLDAVAHERSVDVGLSTQEWGPWLGDVGKTTAVTAVLAAIGGALGLALVRRFTRRWWIPAAGVVVAFGVVSIYLSPLLIEPLFNRFDPLPRGQLRSDVLELADRAGVDVGEVYRVDASRRTTAANAYVGGLGHTKRVVLYDNLIEDFPDDQVRSVVAHELGHVEGRDLHRGLLWLALVAPAGTLLTQRLAERFGTWKEDGKPGPEVIPALALALALVSFGVGAAGNVLSRQVEARADVFALDLTRDPDAFVALEKKLALSNVSDPDPPGALHAVFGTHPTTLTRIGIGKTWAAEH